MTDLFGHVAPATEPPDGEKGQEERGAFYTPDALALSICCSVDGLLTRKPRVVLEPGCGGGAFLRAVDAVWPKLDLLWGVDLVPACSGPGSVEKLDLFAVAQRCDLIVGNPDFGIAERAVRHCLSLLAPGGHLAFLLRAAFLGGAGRVPLYRDFPLRYFQPIAQRPSFTCDGKTDPMEYGLYVWMDGFKGRGEILSPLVWR